MISSNERIARQPITCGSLFVSWCVFLLVTSILGDDKLPRVAVFTTGPAPTENLDAEIVAVSRNLADRERLGHDLAAVAADVFLVELKAAAIDVVAEQAAERGVDVVLAAEAARCAEGQGKFWQYHDALFADQSKLDEAGLVKTAQTLGLNEKSFQTCLAAGSFKAQIEEDVQEGTKAGVTGTPGFFINGEFLNGAQTEVEFEKIIELELAISRDPTSVRASR